MKISRIFVYAFDLPLHETQYLSKGRRFDRFGATVLRIDTDEGVTGWGEVTPWGSSYLAAFPGGVRQAVCDMAPALLGEDPRSPEAIYRKMDQELAGHVYAKALVDFAVWDILGKWTGLPVHALLGGAQNTAPHMSASLHLDAPDGMLAERDRKRALGVGTFSVKMGQGIETDSEVIERFQAARLPHETLVFDANGGWSQTEAVTIMNRAEASDFVVEQPCSTYEATLSVRRKTRQAISLDECMTDLHVLVRAIKDNACEAVNIKLARVGGYTKARQIRDLLLAYDLKMYVMCMGGTVLSDTISAKFARTVPTDRLIGAWASQDYVTLDICPNQGARPENGFLVSPDLPGLGVTPDAEIMGLPMAVFK